MRPRRRARGTVARWAITAPPVGDGTVWRVDVATGAATPFATGLTVPEGVFFEGDRLTVAEWALPSPIVRFPPAGGGVAGAVTLGAGFAHVYGVASDGAGGTLVADHAGRVVALAPAAARTS